MLIVKRIQKLCYVQFPLCWLWPGVRTDLVLVPHSVPPSPSLLEGGIECPTKFSKRGRVLTGPHFLKAGCWERGVDLFQEGEGGCNFYVKNKLKSEIFYVCVCACVRACACVCFCVFGERGYEKPIYRGVALKRRPWTACILFEKLRPETGEWMNLKNILCAMPPLLVIRTFMPW